jgi:hypothetical protein
MRIAHVTYVGGFATVLNYRCRRELTLPQKMPHRTTTFRITASLSRLFPHTAGAPKPAHISFAAPCTYRTQDPTTQNVLYLPHHFTRLVGRNVSSWPFLFFLLQFSSSILFTKYPLSERRH